METDRQEASIIAREWKVKYLQGATSHLVDVANSENAFEFYARMIPKTSNDDWVLLNRKDDGILAHFGNHNVEAITTGAIRQYIEVLNSNRPTPLAVSTQKKHVGTIRKALRYARENGKITVIPEIPKLEKLDQKPRGNFTPKEFFEFYQCLKADVKKGELEREVFNIVKFVPVTFIRPTEPELMGLRVRHITVHEKKNDEDQEYLTMKIKGKTGTRHSISLPLAVSLFKNQVARYDLQPDDYLWFPETANRKYAITKFSRLFTELLKKHGFQYTNDGEKRSSYSLRHFGLSSRLHSSGGKINVYNLANNAGTSVQMLEKFYIKGYEPSKGSIANLLYFDRD